MTIADAQAYCTAQTKRSGSNFYYSFLFLPKAKREAMYTVYAFCKTVDSAVDEPTAGSDPKEELKRWRSELEAVYRGTPSSPITVSLAHHVKALSIPKVYFEELINGVEMDLFNNRYVTFDELSLYCYRVASVVGLICLHVFGVTSPRAQDYAVNLGMAFQLTNILRDLKEDAARGRFSLPLDETAGAVSLDRLRSGDVNGQFVDMMRAQIARAEDYYRRSAPLEGRIDADSRPTLVAMTEIYHSLLRKIARRPRRVLRHRVSLSVFAKLRIGYKALRQRA